MPTRQMNDERYMQRGVVNKEAVSLLSMLTQTLAVISAEDDQCVVVQALGLERSNQPPHLRVGKGDFPIVGVIFVFSGIRGERTVRVVRMVQVHPPEKLRTASVASAF